MKTASGHALDESLCDLLIASALYEATRTGLEIAVAGRWELEVAIRERLRRWGPTVHAKPEARSILEAWLADAVTRMHASTAAMHVRFAGHGLVQEALASAWAHG